MSRGQAGALISVDATNFSHGMTCDASMPLSTNDMTASKSTADANLWYVPVTWEVEGDRAVRELVYKHIRPQSGDFPRSAVFIDPDELTDNGRSTVYCSEDALRALLGAVSDGALGGMTIGEPCVVTSLRDGLVPLWGRDVDEAAYGALRS